jgi:hypothetical protein
MWPFNYAPHLTSRILCVLRGYAFFVKVCSSRKPPVLHTFYNTWSKLHSSHRRAPTPFVSPVGNPPTDQDSNGVPCRVFRIFFVGRSFHKYTLVPIFRCLLFSLSLSLVFKKLVYSDQRSIAARSFSSDFHFSNTASPLYSRSGVGRSYLLLSRSIVSESSVFFL